MELYYKEWNTPEIEIPQSTIILDKRFVGALHTIQEYPNFLCWEVWVIEKIKNNTEGYFDFSKNIIDIGAGLGEYCWLLPFNHAYAFEPNKKTEYLIHTNLVLHDRVDTVDTFNCLLSDKVEDVNFDGFTCHEVTNVYDKNPVSLKQTNILDNFNLDNIGLIKIDVEGMEEKVLRGGIGTIIRNNYPPILFECWDVWCEGMTQEKHDSLFNYLKSLGYEILEYWGDWETHLAVHKNQLNK